MIDTPGQHNRDRSPFVLFGIGLLCTVLSQPVIAEPAVRAEAIADLAITVSRSVPAEAVSRRMTTISSQLSASIIALPVREGDAVSAGEVLAELDCQDSQLARDRALAELDALTANRVLASQQLGRLNQLRQSNNASEEAINQKQAELNVVNARIQSQRIDIAIAERQVEKCSVRAPYAGIVTEKFAEVGDFVSPGNALVHIVDHRNVELKADVTGSELEAATRSEQLLFLYQEETYPVSVRTVIDVIDSTAQTRELRLSFSDAIPLAGAVGRLQWSYPGTWLPASMALTRDGSQGVFMLEQRDGDSATAVFRTVPGIRPGRPFRVDLAPGTLLVTEGRYGLRDGDRVTLQ